MVFLWSWFVCYILLLKRSTLLKVKSFLNVNILISLNRKRTFKSVVSKWYQFKLVVSTLLLKRGKNTRGFKYFGKSENLYQIFFGARAANMGSTIFDNRRLRFDYWSSTKGYIRHRACWMLICAYYFFRRSPVVVVQDSRLVGGLQARFKNKPLVP